MKHQRTWLLALLASGVALIVAVVQRRNNRQWTKQVRKLLALAQPSNGVFNYDQLVGLPEPVQRYFRHVLPDQHPYINTVRLTHGGRFRTGPKKGWIAIKGEQYFTTNPPGFIWQGRTALFTAIDKHIAGRGNLTVSLASLAEVVNIGGSAFDQGELLRWLGESVWFPTNLLPSERLSWSLVDEHTSELHYQYDGLSLHYLVSFNDIGEIIRLETKRYIAESQLETWVGELFDYQTINGVKVPTRIQATWKLPEGDYTYANFRLKRIEYNHYQLF